ncbi:Cuticle protein [Nesidiocoris tenuis]|uniref:Cuticle protein n=1 Tax=Nesidiocoris tenuis TaxID=355587 RepID=A0ABN7AP48_9HEMI|nr:Cuticle protein [Nesidiocoris tenuis]
MRILFIAGLMMMVIVGQSAAQGLLGKIAGRVAQLVSYKNENYGPDGYEFAYETDDGTKREEKGSFVNGIWTVIGKSIWRDEQGNEHAVEYQADDKGTKAEVMEGRLSAGALASLAG